MKELILLTIFFGAGVVAQDSARVVHVAAPGYPQMTSGGRIEGEVPVEVDVTPDGAVRKAQSQSGPAMLRAAAETAARQWRFAPSGPEKVQIVFAFILQEGLGDPPAVASLFKAPNRIEVFAMKRELVVISDPPVGVIKNPKKVRKPKN